MEATQTTTDMLTASAACRQCGQVFHYAPILLGSNDYGNLTGRCDECQAAAERAAADAQEAQRRQRNEDTIRRIIPVDLRETDRHHPQFNSQLWNAVSRWRPDPTTRTLVIHGPAEKSKTRCMALLAMKAIRANIFVTWTSAIAIKNAAGDRHREKELCTPARAVLDQCHRAAWLFIDDLGKQGEWTPAFESAFFSILDTRITHRLATIISSNSDPRDFGGSISAPNAAPIISRILDRATMLRV